MSVKKRQLIKNESSEPKKNKTGDTKSVVCFSVVIDKNIVLGSTPNNKIFNGMYNGTFAAFKSGCTSESEEKIALDLDHENVVKTFAVIKDDKSNTYLAMEKADRDLFDEIDATREHLSADLFGYMMLDIAEGMIYLHSKNVMHLDLNPKNILVFKKSNNRIVCKVADFGLAETGEDRIEYGFKSTPGFMAPEVKERYKISKAADVYSFGVIMYQMAKRLKHTQMMNGYFMIAEQCCDLDPDSRCTFKQLAKMLKIYISSITAPNDIVRSCKDLIKSQQGKDSVA